jgi:hypothetical protein
MPKGKDTRFHGARRVGRDAMDMHNEMREKQMEQDDRDAHEAMEDARGNDGLKPDSGFSEREMRD